MTSIERKLQNWQTMKTADEAEREKLRVLLAPPAANPPELLQLVRCKILRPVMIGGKPAEVGSVVELQRHDAMSLSALKKIQICEVQTSAQ